MSGVVKIATMIGAMAGEGAAVMTVTLAAYITAIVVPAGRYQVSINESGGCGQEIVILKFAGSGLTTFSGSSIRVHFEHDLLITK